MRTFSSRSPWQRRRPRPRRGAESGAFRCPHTTPDTYQKTARIETRRPERGALCDKRPALGGGMPAAPRAPVAPGEHEVPVCGDGLLVGRVRGRRAALVRAHLEEAEVLPVPRRRRRGATRTRRRRPPLARRRPKTAWIATRGGAFASLRASCGRSAVRYTSPSSRRRAAASRGRAPPPQPPGSRPSSGARR